MILLYQFYYQFLLSIDFTINETKIDSSVNGNEIYLPGFEVVRKDRSVNGRSGGGVCIYLRSNINYQIRDDLVMTILNVLSSKLSDPTPDLLLLVRGINLQTLPKISFGNLSLKSIKWTLNRKTSTFWGI